VNSYLWQPKLDISRDGTRLLFASNFDLSNISQLPVDYSDTYLITLNSGVAITLPAPTAPANTSTKVVRYEQDNASVQYQGAWYPNYGSFNSGGSAVLAMDANAQAKLTFTGTGVKWIGFSDPWSGKAQVYLDGALAATVDTYSANQAAQTVQYSAENLINGSHVLTIVALGTESAQSAGAWVWVDAFDVTEVVSAKPAAKPTSGLITRPKP
jgi:hypothetical protein